MPQILFRQIKANPIKWSVFWDEIAKTLDDTVKPELLEWFDKVANSWVHKPDFKATKSITPSEMTVNVYPIGENAKIWRYVTFGNPTPYPIPKTSNKHAKMLRFRGGYKPRTTPQGGYKGPGKATGKWYIRKQVTHPVVPGRHFEKHIARWYYPRYRQVMKNAVARGLRKANAR
jgi:hypothetical protein